MWDGFWDEIFRQALTENDERRRDFDGLYLGRFDKAEPPDDLRGNDRFIIGVDQANDDSEDHTVIHISDGQLVIFRKWVTPEELLDDDMGNDIAEMMTREMERLTGLILFNTLNIDTPFDGTYANRPEDDAGDLTAGSLERMLELLRREPPLLNSTPHDEPPQFYREWQDYSYPVQDPRSSIFFPWHHAWPCCQRCGAPVVFIGDEVLCSNWVECDWQFEL
jgi:hypothetical protein